MSDESQGSLEIMSDATEQVEQQVEAAPKEDLYDKRFSALARKQREFLNQQRKAKEEEGSLRDKIRRELEEEYKGKFKEDAFGALKGLGSSYDELTDLAIGRQAAEPTESERVASLEAKLAEQAELFEQYKNEREENERQQTIDKALNKYRSSIDEVISSDLDKYELINHYGAHELVMETAIAYHQETGEIPNASDIADYTEEYLFEEAQKSQSSLSGLNKLKVQSPLSQEEKQEATEDFSKATTSTLTNNTATGTSAPNRQYLDEERSKKEAAKLLRWND